MANSAASGRPGFRAEESPRREVDVLRRALDGVRKRLPEPWTWKVQEDAHREGAAFDALVELVAPDGSTTTLVIEVKRQIATRDVPFVLEQLEARTSGAGIASPLPMVVARYLPPSTRERLEEEGVAYADATGNLRIETKQPALFLRDVGADRDPWRGPGRPRGTLKGAPAARVVRTLVDFSPPYTVPKLIERSGASTGATYRVVKFLEEEDLLTRQPRGPITAVEWRRLIERWSQDYGLLRSEGARSFLFPRGIERIPDVLRVGDDIHYVLTGSLAAKSFAPHAPPRVAMIYADDIEAVANRLGLRPVDKGANVLLAATQDGVSGLRAKKVGGVMTAAPSQIAVDLLTGPGRSPSEGQAMLDWMEAHESEWRA